MIQHRKNLFHLLQVKKIKILIWILAFILLLFVIKIGIKNYNKFKYVKKLDGYWNIEVENSDWVRSDGSYFSTFIINFTKNTIDLPIAYSSDTLSLHKKETIGTWEMTSISPDTIFINAPNHPLHGKYAIKFYNNPKGYAGFRNLSNKIELKNDSTFIICCSN